MKNLLSQINITKKWNEEYQSFFVKLVILSLFILFIFVLSKIISILAVFFLAIFLTLLFSPFLNSMNKYKINDWVGLLVIYFILWLFLSIIFFAIIPIFIDKINNFVDFSSSQIGSLKELYHANWVRWFGLPKFMEKILVWALSWVDLNVLFNFLENNFVSIWAFFGKNFSYFASNSLWLISSIAGVLMNSLFIVILNIFLVLERKKFKNFFYSLLPKNSVKYLKNREDEIMNSLYSWIKWQLTLCFVIFLFAFIWLNILSLFWFKIDWIFTLALITWLMEFIPIIWFVISILTAIAITASSWFSTVFAVLILYVIIQQVEGNVIVPFIMKKNLDLSPVIVILAMMIWWTLFWIIWIILAIPLVTIIKIFVEDFISWKNKVK